MMIRFSKYQSTGNDFIMLENSDGGLDSLDIRDITRWCHRRFGIGADGLIWLRKAKEYDFEMRYYNSDGSRSFCGNGARAAVMFAKELRWIKSSCRFLAIDGMHDAVIDQHELVHLRMSDVNRIDRDDEAFVLNTGSPHFVSFCDDLEQEDIVRFGRKIRYSKAFRDAGINVNLAQVQLERLIMLTYERGVENETYSCGTGATAVALAHVFNTGQEGDFHLQIGVKGGELAVSGRYFNGVFDNIHLIGPSKKVFHGEIAL
jgi:diaminopimelate epimerase